MKPVVSLSRIFRRHYPNHRSRLPRSPLSLDHFLLRQRVLGFYRTVVRACYKLPAESRADMLEFARLEFESRKEENDLRKIRYLLSTGKAEFDRVRGQVGGIV